MLLIVFLFKMKINFCHFVEETFGAEEEIVISAG